ncbi:MAG: MerR family transcriptional regulator [Burkholderiales bacterium]
MKVTEIAKRAGVGVHAVRFYVRAGLIVPRRNPSNNYKQFGEDDVVRLRFIKGVQALGFSLAEIGCLLCKLDAGERDCGDINRQLARKLENVQEQMKELGLRYALMRKVHESWNETAGNDHDVRALCRFLEQQTSNLGNALISVTPTPRPNKSRSMGGSRRKVPNGGLASTSPAGRSRDR